MAMAAGRACRRRGRSCASAAFLLRMAEGVDPGGQHKFALLCDRVLCAIWSQVALFTGKRPSLQRVESPDILIILVVDGHAQPVIGVDQRPVGGPAKLGLLGHDTLLAHQIHEACPFQLVE